jgi:class 3 adenylate cyclase
MLEVIQKSMNPVLTKHGFPELKVRIGMDFGKVAIVKYGIDIDALDEKTIVKSIHLDMIGYTISLAVKMTSLALPDHMVIGQSLYDKLDKEQKEAFIQQPTEQNIWKYVKESTEKNYLLYQNLN